MYATSAQQFAPFERSAAFYDTIHNAKDYARETAVIAHHLRPHDSRQTLSLLDIGCGTGEFSRRFKKIGFAPVVGVEPCKPMAEIARSKGVIVRQCPIQEFSALEPFDAACCLFAAFSYATAAPGSLRPTLDAIHDHLKPGGRFVFDVINTAAAAYAIHEFTKDEFSCGSHQLVRRMRKRFDARSSLVNCTISYQHELGERDEIWTEHHKLRAFTPSEIEYALRDCGFRTVTIFDPEGDPAGDGDVSISSWYFLVVAEAE